MRVASIGVIATCFVLVAFTCGCSTMSARSRDQEASPYPIHGISLAEWMKLVDSAVSRLPATSAVTHIRIRKGPGAVLSIIRNDADKPRAITHLHFELKAGRWKLDHKEAKEVPSKPAATWIGDIASLLQDMVGQIPANARILGIRVQAIDSIEVRTGSRTGSLGGEGNCYIFTKQRGRWLLTKSLHWIS